MHDALLKQRVAGAWTVASNVAQRPYRLLKDVLGLVGKQLDEDWHHALHCRFVRGNSWVSIIFVIIIIFIILTASMTAWVWTLVPEAMLVSAQQASKTMPWSYHVPPASQSIPSFGCKQCVVTTNLMMQELSQTGD